MINNSNKKMWGGRFSASTNKLVEALGESISYDCRLYEVDIIGSKAHAKGLNSIGIFTDEELAIVINALDEILLDIKDNKTIFSSGFEDIHMNIESLLTDKIGDLGKKLHTGRSRNDQVATDTRLYLKSVIKEIIVKINLFRKVLLDKAEHNLDVVMPGFTHLQIAQPVLFSHHMMAYFEMFSRDVNRLEDCFKRVDVMPLGSAALAGSTYGQDRFLIAEELGFSSVSANSMDAVSDRDYIIEFLSCASLLMMHFSKFSEEIVLWLSTPYDFISIDDSFTTGSSIMPQKRNPDVAELTRGKTGRVYGALLSLLTVTKGLPMTYNRDLQEDKEPLFDTIDTLFLVIPVFSEMISTLLVNKNRMKECALMGFSAATDLADFLSKKGVPFRESHRIVGSLVKYCEDKNKMLHELTFEELYKFVGTDIVLPEVSSVLSVEACISAREIKGGTGYDSVKKAILEAKTMLK